MAPARPGKRHGKSATTTWREIVKKQTALGFVLGLSFLAVCALVRRADALTPAPPVGHRVDQASEVDRGVREGTAAIRTADVLTTTMYLPMTTYKFFTAFSYTDNFQNWSSGWPYGTSPFYYGYKEDSAGSKVYYIRLQDEYELAFLTGPTQAIGNFEYQAMMRRADTMPKYWGDEYGLLISPKAIVDPKKLPTTSAYTFQIELKIDPSYDSFYSIAKWSALKRGSRTVPVRVAEGDYITDLSNFWNQFKITRTGDTLNFYLTRLDGSTWKPWKYVYSVTDSALPYELYIGFYAYHSKDDLGNYEIEFQFDNLVMNSHP
jgi:hypothetical protein